MAPPQAVYHALMRPAIIQILRAAGFHAAKPSVIDSMTDIAHRYLELLCQETARHTTDNTLDPMFAGDVEPSVVEVRLALQDVGALLPERDWEEQDFMEQEDTRGVDEFLSWATGPKTELIKKIALDDDREEGVTDYLSALKKRHSKTADDSKYIGTLLGRAPDQGHVTVEGGGEINSIQAWIDERRAPTKSPEPEVESRPASSGLSSVGTMAEEMDLGA